MACSPRAVAASVNNHHREESSEMSNRSLVRAMALAAVVAVAAVPAFAHAPVLGTSPKKGATVSSVRTVSVRFGEAVLTGLISVKHTNGKAVKANASGLVSGKKRLRAAFSKSLAAGKYTVN